MKRLRSYGDDLVSVGEKELERTTSFSSSSSHHRRFYSKGQENGRSRSIQVMDEDRDRDRDREGSISISRGFRKRNEHEFSEGFEDSREGFRGVKKRVEHESEGFDRRKGGFERYRDGGSLMVSPRGGGYGGERERERDRERERERERDRERIHRSESLCVSRREFPKGFRSERHWLRREDGVSSSWRRFDSRGKKDVDDDVKSLPIEKGGGGGVGGGSGGGGSSNSKGGGMESSSKESLRSPRGIKDVKSPSWSKDSTRDSKDSGPEHPKDKKKNDCMVVDSGNGVASGSDMEEGELQPELNQVQVSENRSISEQNVKKTENYTETSPLDGNTEKKASELNSSHIHELGTRKLGRDEDKVSDEIDVTSDKKVSVVEEGKDEIINGVNKSSPSQNDTKEETKSFMKEIQSASTVDDDARLKESQPESSAPTNMISDSHVKMEEHEPKGVEKSLQETEKPKNNFDLEVGFGESNKAIIDEVQKELEPCVPLLKDKGKGVAICSPGEASPTENMLLVERNFISCQDDAMEGPSVRGFELFSTSSGLRSDCGNTSNSKPDSEKLKLEPLDLSLSLPNVSVPPPPPSSPPRARSVQSFGTTLRTGSDCFTTSISFSGSQFIHNPSCSLTHNSVDYDFEQSVKSRPLFQGVDWNALSGTDTLPKEILANTKLVSSTNGNATLHLSQSSQGGASNGRSVQGVDRSSTLQKQQSGKTSYQVDFRSPAQSTGSQDKKPVNREDSVTRIFRNNNPREIEQGISAERYLAERLISLVVSEPIQTMAWKINDMPERSVSFLKDTVCEIILKEENHGKLRALQDVLRKRSDLNLETLLKYHRVQLQIIVALKTTLPDFLQRADSISSSDLAEIYLNMKCRNINCRSALPVDECDCKFCAQKDGYCSSCMCLVCSKFDTASNTCGWVGCDVCNHWCHTDCGLLKLYIRNGRSAAGSQNISEMQFYCLACDHPSEMFGFVKDVFKTCAPEWKSETFIRELEYVRRIFSGSNDYRGKVLHDAAKQLIGRLQSGVNPVEICKQIMAFLNEGDIKSGNAAVPSGRDQLQPQAQAQAQVQAVENNRVNVIQEVTPLSQDPIWSKPNSSKDHSRMENIGVTIPNGEGSGIGGSLWSTETPTGKVKDSGDGLDSIVKIKLAEAQLFQKRADAARKEAQDLQRIANAKNEKVEEEYANRIAKLRLSEVEERRRLKHEELQMLERSHREYFNMKTRMETDIRDLLLKMEATSRNLST